MDGSSVDLIIIPIVAVISVAAWLIPIYWADSHPGKFPRTTTVTAEPLAVADKTAATHPAAGQATVPRQAAAPAGDEDPAPARQLTGSR